MRIGGLNCCVCLREREEDEETERELCGDSVLAAMVRGSNKSPTEVLELVCSFLDARSLCYFHEVGQADWRGWMGV